MSKNKPNQGSPKKPSRRSAVLLRDRAKEHLSKGRVADALAWATENHLSDDVLDAFTAASILKQTNKFESATQAYRKLAEDEPSNRGLQLAFAAILAESGREDQLAEQLKKMESESELAGDEHRILAYAFRSGGLFPQSVSHYGAALMKLEGESQGELAIEFAAVLQEVGEDDKSVRLLKETISGPNLVDPRLKSRALFNLGVLVQNSDPQSAINAYRESLELSPDYENPVANLALLLIGKGELADSILVLKNAHALNQDSPRCEILLASALRLRGDQEQAAEILEEVTETVGDCPALAWELLIRCYDDDGKTEDAIKVCQRWLKRDPGSSIAKHLQAAMGGDDSPSRASAGYVAETFDGFAESFDSVLGNLEYRAPQLIGHLLGETIPDVQPTHCVLDAGCGTGLAAKFLKPFAAKLVGVDLSKRMLAKAAERKLYNDLVQEDLVAHLKKSTHTYDIIVAADTFNYFGDLSELLPSCFSALKENGWLLFTLEMGDTYGETFQLESHGRYTHPPGYLMEQLGECGIEGGEMHQAVLRKENGAEVKGILVAVQKP